MTEEKEKKLTKEEWKKKEDYRYKYEQHLVVFSTHFFATEIITISNLTDFTSKNNLVNCFPHLY